VRNDVFSEARLLNPQRARQVLEVNPLMSAAPQRPRDGWHVFIPRAHDTFEMREVGRGRDLDGEVEILSGLRPGETVIVEGAFLLKAEAEKSRGEGEHHDH
jgi:cobalt-zinc-cadmium efflux system membrane fusion protein